MKYRIKLWVWFIKESKSYTDYSWLRVLLSVRKANTFVNNCMNYKNLSNTDEERYVNSRGY